MGGARRPLRCHVLDLQPGLIAVQNYMPGAARAPPLVTRPYENEVTGRPRK
jgi:hypothetical protein